MTLVTNDDPASLELRYQEIQAAHRERRAQLRRDARAGYRAFQGWAKVRSHSARPHASAETHHEGPIARAARRTTRLSIRDHGDAYGDGRG